MSLVFRDQRDDITRHPDKIHEALRMRGLSADHAIHTAPLIRRERDYRWMDLPALIRSNHQYFSSWERVVIYYLCCTLALLREKIKTDGLSRSEGDFFSTPKDSAERALKKGYFKTMDRSRFGT